VLITGVAHGLGQRSPYDMAPADDFETSRMPLLLLHGQPDATVPIEGSRRLAEAHPGRVELIELANVSHNDLPGAALDDESVRARVLEFLRAPRPRRP
jgi:pimeloyl-ACP methyl ester carboxylesterase